MQLTHRHHLPYHITISLHTILPSIPPQSLHHSTTMNSATTTSAIGFGRQNASTFDEEANSPSNSNSHNSENSVESFLMSRHTTLYNGSFSNKDRRPSTELTMFDNNSSEFTAFKEDDEDARQSMAFGNIPLPDTTPTNNDRNRSSHSEFGTGIQTTQLHEEAKDEYNPNAIGFGTQARDEEKKYDDNAKAGHRRRKSQQERTSFLKKDFVVLKEEQQWNKVQQRLNKVFDEEVSAKLKEYAHEEEFDFQAILDDIEDYQENPDDSNIIEHMQSSFNWNERECDKFFRTIKRILMDKKTSRRSSSMAKILGYSTDEFMTDDFGKARRSIHEPRPNLRKDNDDEKMYLNEFSDKWSGDIVHKLQQYCVEEVCNLYAY